MAHFFTGIRKPGETGDVKPINVHAVLGKVVLTLVSLLIVGYTLLNLTSFLIKVSQNWQEIQFAYQKPSVVRAVRTQYQAKATALDTQFISGKPSEETQMLKEVKAALATPSK